MSAILYLGTDNRNISTVWIFLESSMQSVVLPATSTFVNSRVRGSKVSWRVWIYPVVNRAKTNPPTPMIFSIGSAQAYSTSSVSKANTKRHRYFTRYSKRNNEGWIFSFSFSGQYGYSIGVEYGSVQFSEIYLHADVFWPLQVDVFLALPCCTRMFSGHFVWMFSLPCPAARGYFLATSGGCFPCPAPLHTGVFWPLRVDFFIALPRCTRIFSGHFRPQQTNLMQANPFLGKFTVQL